MNDTYWLIFRSWLASLIARAPGHRAFDTAVNNILVSSCPFLLACFFLRSVFLFLLLLLRLRFPFFLINFPRSSGRSSTQYNRNDEHWRVQFEKQHVSCLLGSGQLVVLKLFAQHLLVDLAHGRFGQLVDKLDRVR